MSVQNSPDVIVLLYINLPILTVVSGENCYIEREIQEILQLILSLGPC